MRQDTVEIYSDLTNAAIMRHPERRFPGVLIQGDTLYILCRNADKVCKAIDRNSPDFEEANELRNHLWALLNHYKKTLIEHKIPLPFVEQF